MNIKDEQRAALIEDIISIIRQDSYGDRWYNGKHENRCFPGEKPVLGRKCLAVTQLNKALRGSWHVSVRPESGRRWSLSGHGLWINELQQLGFDVGIVYKKNTDIINSVWVMERV